MNKKKVKILHLIILNLYNDFRFQMELHLQCNLYDMRYCLLLLFLFLPISVLFSISILDFIRRYDLS